MVTGMKRTILLTSALGVALALGACGGGHGSDKTSQTSPAPAAPTTTVAPSTTAPPTSTAAPAPSAAATRQRVDDALRRADASLQHADDALDQSTGTDEGTTP